MNGGDKLGEEMNLAAVIALISYVVRVFFYVDYGIMV